MRVSKTKKEQCMEIIDVSGQISIDFLKNKLWPFVNRLALFLEAIPYSDEKIKTIDRKYLNRPSRGFTYHNIKFSKFNDIEKENMNRLYFNGINDYLVAYFYYIINKKEGFINLINLKNAH